MNANAGTVSAEQLSSASVRTPLRKTAIAATGQRSTKKFLTNSASVTDSSQRRPRTARDQLTKASEKHGFDDKDAEIEHLKRELEINK